MTAAGSVGLCFTSFVVEGPPGDVGAVLSEISGRLATVSPEAVARESRQLERDSRVRGEDPLNGVMWCRWGARGPGVMEYRELGLAGIDADVLTAYAKRAFAAKNAALAFDGPVPRSMELNLPAGGALLPVTLPPPLGEIPAAMPHRVPAVSGLVAATAASRIMLDLLAARLEARHRPVGGSGWTFHVDQFGDELHVAWLGPASPEGAVETGVLLSELERIASGDVAEADITAHRQALLQAIGLAGRRAVARRAAKNALLARPDLTESAVVADAEAVLARDVWEAGAQWRRSVLVTVADPAFRPATLPWAPTTPPPAPAGPARVLEVRPGFLDSTVVTLSGSELRFADGHNVWGADLTRVAVLTRRPDGLRAFIPEAGRPFELDTSVMRDGEELRILIDAAVPVERQISLDARPATEIPRPTPWPLRPLVGWLGLPSRRRRAIGAGIGAVLLAAGLGLLAVSIPWSVGLLIASVVVGLFVSSMEVLDSMRFRDRARRDEPEPVPLTPPDARNE